MKILLVSFYYSPDLCPGSFRASALVEALQRTVPPGCHIDVITTMPNRYSRFAVEAPAVEEHPGLTIRRIALPAHESGMLDQSKAFIVYGKAVREHTRSARYDVVCATSSRLMTAVLGASIARRVGARLYLDIRDIFTDTIKDVLPSHIALCAKPVFAWLERWAVRRADRVNLVSQGFADYFSTRYPHQRYTYHTNGIDDGFAPAEPAAAPHDGVLSVVYAGNVGEGQGLHSILPMLARRLHGRVRFTVIGDGGRRAALENAIVDAGVDNVAFLPPMKRLDLIAAYHSADVLFVHLNDYAAFKKVLPSKLFEYGATGKPIWAGVDGYAARFVTEEIENAAVFYPCDVEQAVAAFERLRIGQTARAGFIAKFSRTNIVNAMARDIVSLAA